MAYVDPRLQGKPAPVVSLASMEQNNVARLGAMKGSDLAFLDQRIPGYQREIINIIGMGVVENMKDPRLAPKINAPAHGLPSPMSATPRRATARRSTATRPKRCSSRSRGRGKSSGSKARPSGW